MSRRAKARRNRTIDCNIQYLSDALIANGKAAYDGPEKKTWHLKDVRVIKPLTEHQKEVFQCFFQDDRHVCVYGSAGSGKTFLTLYLAFQEVLDSRFDADRIIIVRSAVPSRDIGFMPGTYEEKLALYELPYMDILADLFGRNSTYGEMKKAGLVEFVSTSYIRGLTWDNAIILVDEFQNMSLSEIDSVVTRVGQGSRLIMCGDVTHQCDLKQGMSGAQQFIEIANAIDDFSIVQFTADDIVRSNFVKTWIKTRELFNY
jgi:phosphate starvation-inducible protein PhoH